MKIITLALVILIANLYPIFGNNFSAKNLISESARKIEFIENKGQIADQHGNVNHNVLFIAEVPYGTITIRRDGISYSFVKYDEVAMSKHSERLLSRDRFDELERFDAEPIPVDIYRVDMRLKSSNFSPKIETFEMTEDYNNYYHAHCPDGITNVRKFRTVKLIDIYPDIDFVVYANNTGLVQYDFVVKPGANPDLINFAFEGATDVAITATGDLRVETPFGSIEQKAPIAYQPNNLAKYLNSRDFKSNTQSPISQYTKNSDNSISFALANYDITKALIIDPPTRLWGTYYGGFGNDEGRSIAVDVFGNVFIAGYTWSNNSIATQGSHQRTIGGSWDAFLVKFNNSGIRQWGTFYGGNNTDFGMSVATDGLGDVYLAGETLSEEAISTVGSHQSSIGLAKDAFLVKFNSSGERQWGTYYGGTGSEAVESVTTDLAGNVLLVGNTSSGDAIATDNSHQSSLGGSYNAFLVKFTNNGLRLWGTYYGGDGGDDGQDVITDISGNVYITGYTGSGIGISTYESHQSMDGGGFDAFLVKFNSNGVRQWGTYYGGRKIDVGNSVSTDISGNVYLAGKTKSPTAIATEGSHQSTLGGLYDAFLVKFNSNGVRQWGTYYGGSSDDVGTSVTIDGSGNIYLTGETRSNNTISTSGSHQSIYGGGGEHYGDAFLVKFNNNGIRQWGTYYGGSGGDGGVSVKKDDLGNIYLVGNTSSKDAIATVGSHQSIIGGERDAFLVKFSDSPNSVIEQMSPSQMKVYPNPAESLLYVDFLVPMSGAKIKLQNLLGVTVFEQELSAGAIHEKASINVENIPTGLYLLIVQSGENYYFEKVILR
ncbi:MAG: SBBP repeat-containing protein [Candidatus Kapabacteria bacterium]|nr:SBBP repeat-containing protein [Candidatus Kapabacteria bacterium]